MSLWEWCAVVEANAAEDEAAQPQSKAPTMHEHRARLARDAARTRARAQANAAADGGEG